MKKVLLFAVVSVLALVASAQDKFVGGDISLLPKYEEHGAKYLDKNGSQISGSMVTWFKERGWNAMRVRLFVDPSQASAEHKGQGVCQDLDFVKALGKQIKDAGLSFMLDFHYSDTWTDPGKHATPNAWTSSDPDVLATTLYEYTKDCLNALKSAGAEPDFVQPGNEITYGMLWPTGHCYPDGGNYGSGTFANFAKYLQAGIKAIREVCPQSKIVIQTEMSKSDNVTNFYKTLKNYTSDYDVIGISYYPHYHGTLTVLNTLLTSLESSYPDKKIQLVETGYYHIYYPEDAKYSLANFPNWPATEAGQLQFSKDLIDVLNNHSNVNGLYWWFPEANEYGLDWETQRVTDGWYNASLFDNDTGKAMAALYELNTYVGGSGYSDEPEETGGDITSQFQNMDFEQCTMTGSDITDCPGWTFNYEQGWGTLWVAKVDEWKSALVGGNFCFQSWVSSGSSLAAGNIVYQSLDNLPAGTYTISAVVHTDYDGIQLFANNDAAMVTATSSWGTAYEVKVTTTLSAPGTLTLGLKLTAAPTTTSEVNLYADNFKVTSQTTGISVINTNVDNGHWYTLDGRHLSADPISKGIYIKNGRKVVIR